MYRMLLLLGVVLIVAFLATPTLLTHYKVWRQRRSIRRDRSRHWECLRCGKPIPWNSIRVECWRDPKTGTHCTEDYTPRGSKND